jgi:hypothetical protein
MKKQHADTLLKIATRLEAKEAGSETVEQLKKIAQYLTPSSPVPSFDYAGGGPNPNIQPFAQIKQVEPTDDREVHKAGVTFKAPKDVSESDIMHAIMSAVRDLGVEIDGFTWQRSELKQKG